MYLLEAIIAQEKTLDGALLGFRAARVVPLSQGLCLVPMIGHLLQELEIRFQGSSKVTNPDVQQFSASLYPQFERLLVGVDKFARQLSLRGRIAYVEATFTGGYGGHATLAWEKGEIVEGPGDDINTVLRRFGVVKHPGLDEFDTIGLGRHRSTREWVADALA